MSKIFTILFILLFNFLFIVEKSFSNENKIRIGLLVPLSGDNAQLGKQIIKAIRMAVTDIIRNNIEIYPITQIKSKYNFKICDRTKSNGNKSNNWSSLL